MEGHLTLAAAVSPDASQWAAIALGVITVLMVVFRPMGKKKKKDPLQAPPPSSLAQQRAVEREMSNLLVEYEQMIRQMSAGVETRAARLELLIREADQKIALLRGMMAGHRNGSAAATFELPLDPLNPLDSKAGGIMVETTATASFERLPDLEAATPEPRNLQVYELSDQGLSSREIAKQIGRSSAEVEMILAMRGP